MRFSSSLSKALIRHLSQQHQHAANKQSLLVRKAQLACTSCSNATITATAPLSSSSCAANANVIGSKSSKCFNSFLANRDLTSHEEMLLSSGLGLYRTGSYRPSSRLFFQFSTDSSSDDDKKEKSEAEAEAEAKTEGEGEANNEEEEEKAQAETEEKVDLKELQAKCAALEATVAKMGGENADYKDKLIRTLADMENLRERTARQVENSNKFAIQGFVKDLLDVSDNLERALGAVDEEYLKKEGGKGEGEGDDASKAFNLLKSLYEGIEMTEKQMLQVFSKNGLERFDPTDQAFDPNLHLARFEVPVPDKEPGTVVVVTKVGYKLHDRVIRPAEVGVVPS